MFVKGYSRLESLYAVKAPREEDGHILSEAVLIQIHSEPTAGTDKEDKLASPTNQFLTLYIDQLSAGSRRTCMKLIVQLASTLLSHL